MKVAIAQINPIVGDLEGNVVLCLDAARQAQSLGADLVVLPELALPGCHPKDILLDPGFVRAVGKAAAHLAEMTRGLPPVILGTVLLADLGADHPTALYNAAVLLENGEQAFLAAKRSLPMEDVFFDPRWFVSGPQPKVLQISGRRLVVLVGGEREHPNSLPDAEMVVSLAASPFVTGIHSSRLAFARSFGRPLIYANLVGGNDDLIYDGRSLAVDGAGTILCQLPAFDPEVQALEIPFLDSDIKTPPRHRHPPEVIDPGFEDLLWGALVLGIRDFARKNNIQRAFVGLSGGVDSALVAVLATEALGAEHVSCIAMPSRYTDPRSTQSAEVLAKNLGTKFEVVPIELLHAAFENVLGTLLDGSTTAENVQARIRMVVMMAYVNRYGGMLLNTGNKTEASLGYATLYGDTAGSLSPIGDLTKTQVYQLARWINAKRGVIPQFILERPPSAELRPGQVDPFDYDQISPELETMVQENRSNPAMRAAEHKRAQMGVVLKVSPKTFGPGRMIPITRK